MHSFKNEGENDADKGHQGTKKGNAQRSLFSHKGKGSHETGHHAWMSCSSASRNNSAWTSGRSGPGRAA